MKHFGETYVGLLSTHFSYLVMLLFLYSYVEVACSYSAVLSYSTLIPILVMYRQDVKGRLILIVL